MGDGVGRHHQFKAVEAREDVAVDVAAPGLDEGGVAVGAGRRPYRGRDRARPSRFGVIFLEGFEDVEDDFAKEGAGTERGVENLNCGNFLLDGFLLSFRNDLDRLRRFGGEAIGEIELRAEDMIHGANHESDDWHGRVELAALDLLLLVVRLEELFVEVDDRVFASAARLLPEVGGDLGRIDLGEHVHHVGDAQFVERDTAALRHGAAVAHHVLEERVRVRDEVDRLIDAERFGRLVEAARGEESVNDRLRVHIGEVGFVEVVHKGPLHFLKEEVDETVRGLDAHRLEDAVLDFLGDLRHPLSERGGCLDDLAPVRIERRRPRVVPPLIVRWITRPLELGYLLLETGENGGVFRCGGAMDRSYLREGGLLLLEMHNADRAA